MTEPRLPKQRQKILEILMKLAEEPDDIKDGTGTFITFRVEYLINEIAQELTTQREEIAREVEGMKEPDRSPLSKLWFRNQVLDDALKLLKEKGKE